MDKEKIVVILLLATIILSIASTVVTFSLNFDERGSSQKNNAVSGNNAGNVQLVLTEAIEEGSNEGN